MSTNIQHAGKRGLLLVISGPSGVGKGTVCKRFLQVSPVARYSISVTTRVPRDGEVEGKDYFFRTVEEFEQMICENAFLEYMKVFDTHYYGTPAQYVDECLAAGLDIILEIDVQGARRVKARRDEAVMVFIAPPDLKSLEHRLRKRNTENEVDLNKRMTTAREELKSIDCYDYIVVNHEKAVGDAVEMLKSIVDAEKCRIKRNERVIKALMPE